MRTTPAAAQVRPPHANSHVLRVEGAPGLTQPLPHPTESEPRGVSVYLIPPSPLDLYIHKSPKITCLVVDLASVDGMSLKWSREGEDLVNKSKEVSKRHFNMTYSVTSTLPVDANDWIEGVTYRCEVSHPHLPRAIARTIAKSPGEPQAKGTAGEPPIHVWADPTLSTGKRAAPEVYVFPPPEEGQGTKDTVTLTCLVQNFFPVDISVQWLRNDALVQTDQQATTQPLKANSSSPASFVFSRLEVHRADWEKRHKFTCQVVHEALPGFRTLKKSVSKEPGN